jgi:hypothetical protein
MKPTTLLSRRSAGVILVALMGCEGGPEPQREATASAVLPAVAPTPVATPATTVASAPAPMAASKVTLCEAHKLALGGTGTRDDMCKYDGDVVTARYAGEIRADGARFTLENPWRREVTWLSVAVYYYDAAGQQLVIEEEGKEHWVVRVDGMAVKLSPGVLTEVSLGWPKEKLPETVRTVEAEVLAFGWSDGDDSAYFASTRPYRNHRAIDGGNGPTGIEICDAYRAMLESCSKQFPDALTAMRDSLRQYNNAVPAAREKLAPGLESRCEEATTSMQERCARCPDDSVDPSCRR